MKNYFRECPHCNKVVKIEAEGMVLAVEAPTNHDLLTSDQKEVQTNQEQSVTYSTTKTSGSYA